MRSITATRSYLQLTLDAFNLKCRLLWFSPPFKAGRVNYLGSYNNKSLGLFNPRAHGCKTKQFEKYLSIKIIRTVKMESIYMKTDGKRVIGHSVSISDLSGKLELPETETWILAVKSWQVHTICITRGGSRRGATGAPPLNFDGICFYLIQFCIRILQIRLR